MKPNVKITVIMAVYNTSFDLVHRALESVRKQDFTDYELLVVDDGSSFDLGQKILQYCEKQEKKISYIRSENKGQSLAVNRAIGFSQGEYITIIDSDDEYKPNHLSSCLREMKDADLVSSLTETIVSTDADYYVADKDDLRKNIHVDDCILFATLFGKKEVFKTIHFENCYSADSHFYEQAAAKYKVKKLEKRTYIYYRNTNFSITAQMKKAR